MSGMGATAHRARLRRWLCRLGTDRFPLRARKNTSPRSGVEVSTRCCRIPVWDSVEPDHVDLITGSSRRAKEGSVGKPERDP
jgi:hypothetical protein